jgi:hypothetical protein
LGAALSKREYVKRHEMGCRVVVKVVVVVDEIRKVGR